MRLLVAQESPGLALQPRRSCAGDRSSKQKRFKEATCLPERQRFPATGSQMQRCAHGRAQQAVGTTSRDTTGRARAACSSGREIRTFRAAGRLTTLFTAHVHQRTARVPSQLTGRGRRRENDKNDQCRNVHLNVTPTLNDVSETGCMTRQTEQPATGDRANSGSHQFCKVSPRRCSHDVSSAVHCRGRKVAWRVHAWIIHGEKLRMPALGLSDPKLVLLPPCYPALLTMYLSKCVRVLPPVLTHAAPQSKCTFGYLT